MMICEAFLNTIYIDTIYKGRQNFLFSLKSSIYNLIAYTLLKVELIRSIQLVEMIRLVNLKKIKKKVFSHYKTPLIYPSLHFVY